MYVCGLFACVFTHVDDHLISHPVYEYTADFLVRVGPPLFEDLCLFVFCFFADMLFLLISMLIYTPPFLTVFAEFRVVCECSRVVYKHVGVCI